MSNSLLYEFDKVLSTVPLRDVEQAYEFRIKLIQYIEDAECNERLIEEKGPW